MSWKNGSGKWTIAKILAEKLGYKHISIGGLRREVAHSMGLTISEFDILWELPENKEKFDLQYERYQKELDVNSGIILDSRMGFYCQPKSFKIFLNVSDDEAARRIFGDKNRIGDEYTSLEDVKKATIQRNANNERRYKELYNIDITDMKNFDLVVDTDGKTPQQVAEEIIIKFNEFQK